MEMRDRKHDKTELDAIGKRLLAVAALRETEIDRIAARENIFEGVMRRISLNSESPRNARPSFVFRHRLAFGSSLAAVLCVAVFGLVLQQKGSPFVSGIDQFPVAPPESARPGITPQVIVKGFTEGRAELIEEPTPPEPTAQRAVYRQPEPLTPKAQRASHRAQPNNDFVAVTYTGDGGESARGGRVVRVDVPRSTLFAMGFNVSLENDSPTVKADLLIGPDGVTRAVRLVD